MRVLRGYLCCRVGVGAPVEQELDDLEVAVPRRGDEAGGPVLYGQAMREGASR